MNLVSVIVTTYNRKEFLSETIQSILNQTYKNFELIVVDNYSNYEYFSHINSFNDSRIKPFQHRNNGIIAVNRNYGIEKAKGEYLAFCDDDDSWHHEKLQKQIQYILTNKLENEKVVLYSNCNYIYDDHEKAIRKKKISSINDLILCNQVCLSSSLVSSNGDKIYFNKNEELIAVEDYFLWCTLKGNGYKFYLIEEELVNYRVASNSISKRFSSLNHLKAILVIINVYIKNKNTKISCWILSYSVLKKILKFLTKS